MDGNYVFLAYSVKKSLYLSFIILLFNDVLVGVLYNNNKSTNIYIQIHTKNRGKKHSIRNTLR